MSKTKGGGSSKSKKSHGTKKISKLGKSLVTPKTESLKAHHAKPYRKRHYGLLTISIFSTSLLLTLLILTSISNSNATKSAKNLLADIFGAKSSQQTSQLSATISSTYGFSFQYDQLKLYASAIDSASGDLYVGDELNTNRAYNLIRLAPFISDPSSNNNQGGSVNIQYYSKNPSTDLAKLEAELITKQNPNFVINDSSSKELDGINFLVSNWQNKPLSGIAANFKSSFTSYVGLVNGSPLTITLKSGLVADNLTQSSLESVINSLKFNKSVDVSLLPTVSPNQPQSDLSLFDKLTFTGSASAAVPAQPSSSERISTLFSPAVVKIYNAYCMDILMNGEEYITDSCQGATGSGFFVGNEGYIGTNGHVAVSRPIDIVILDSFERLNAGDSAHFEQLVVLSGLTELELLSAPTQQEKLAVIIDKFYSIPESVFTATNDVSNILVGLSEKQPDLRELMNATKQREKYAEQDTIKPATLKAYDYRAIDGGPTGVFKSSDVALLKIEGSGYPSVKIGTISSLTQGSGLSIIGYPGAASTNQLVESTQSKATLTSGKVSSIKNATGSQKQLIETDATIGHGNSGGPAFSDAGEVVGIATYTIDGSGEGDGVFNYVRDIGDLNDLATKSTINITGVSETQTHWQKGIDFFYQARYSKALKEFAKVKELYPQHPEVDRLVGVSQQRIASGEEVKDFPIILVGVGAFVFIILSAAAVVLIIRHKRHHKLYNTQQDVIAEPVTLPPATTQSQPPVSSPMATDPLPSSASPAEPLPNKEPQVEELNTPQPPSPPVV